MNNDVQKLTEAYGLMLKEEFELSHINNILDKIDKSVGKISETTGMIDGIKAKLAFEDGKTYEIQIRPVRTALPAVG